MFENLTLYKYYLKFQLKASRSHTLFKPVCYIYQRTNRCLSWELHDIHKFNVLAKYGVLTGIFRGNCEVRERTNKMQQLDVYF